MVREGMRGADQQQSHIFSYVSSEERVRKDHPLRTIRALVDEVLQQLSPRFDAMYARVGRPSIPPALKSWPVQISQIGPWCRESTCITSWRFWSKPVLLQWKHSRPRP